MISLSSFTLSGLDELNSSLKKAIKAYPDLAEERLKKIGNKFKKEVKEKTDEEVKTRSGKLKKGYKLSKVYGYGINMQIDFMGTAPHFHLVENGHVKYNRKGEVIGFTPGKHVVDKAEKNFQDILPNELKKLVEDISKECDLD